MNAFQKRSEPLFESMQRRWKGYGIAASATGVSVLALSSAAAAEIVFMPANVTIGRNGSYSLDLNHDGIADFILFEQVHRAGGSLGASAQVLWARGLSGNQVKCLYSFCLSTFLNAAALRQGVDIGPENRPYGWAAGAIMAQEEGRNSGTYVVGVWRHISDHYLGLKFKINGETHFGWARMSVSFHGGTDQQQRMFHATLTGYAYETVPNKAVEAGQESDHDAASAAQPNAKPSFTPAVRNMPTLGLLALGSNALVAWRRDDQQTLMN